MDTDTHLFLALLAAELDHEAIDSWPHFLGGAGRPDWLRKGLTSHWALDVCIAKTLSKRQTAIPLALAEEARERGDHDYGIMLHYLGDAFDRSKNASASFACFTRQVQTLLVMALAGHVTDHPLDLSGKGSPTRNLRSLLKGVGCAGPLPVFDEVGGAKVKDVPAPKWATLDATVAEAGKRGMLTAIKALDLAACVSEIEQRQLQLAPILGYPVRYERELRDEAPDAYYGALCQLRKPECKDCPWAASCFSRLVWVDKLPQRTAQALPFVLADVASVVALAGLRA